MANILVIGASRGTGLETVKRALEELGAGDSRNQGGCLYNLGFNALLGRVYGDKNVQEHLIRSSDLAKTIARPVILTDRPTTGAPGRTPSKNNTAPTSATHHRSTE